MSLPPNPSACPNTSGLAATVASHFVGTQPDVLIVEDDNDGRKILTMALQNEALNVVQSASGDDAQDLLDQGLRPHVMIADINLPGQVQGFDLALSIARNLPSAGIILMSGGFDPDNGDSGPLNALRISKPASLRSVIEAVNSFLPAKVATAS